MKNKNLFYIILRIIYNYNIFDYFQDKYIH